MSETLLKNALKLSKSERILLVEQLWDSIANEQDAPELTTAQKAELDRRYARFKRTGQPGKQWSEVKQGLKKRA